MQNESRLSTQPNLPPTSEGVVPPGPRGLPLVGHAPAFVRDRLGFLTRCARTYGDVVRLELRGPTYLLASPDDIRHVLVTNRYAYSKTPRLARGRERGFYGDALQTNEGAAHHERRQALNPLFRRGEIARFAPLVLERTERLLARWRPGSEVDVASDLSALTQEVIQHALFGDRGDDEELRRAILARKAFQDALFESLLPAPDRWPTRRLARWLWRRRGFDQALAGVADAGADGGEHLVARMVADHGNGGAALPRHQAAAEAAILAITGYETLGDALAWTCHLVATHPEVERRFHEELERERMPAYVGQVLAESMRLFPPTWLFVRMAREEDVLPSGFFVPAGTKLYLSQWVTHRDPRWFPQPERFDPERFAEGDATRPRHAYFPFGAGTRRCIGEAFALQEGTLVLATILRRVRFEPVPGHPIVPAPGLTLKPKHGIRMRVVARVPGSAPAQIGWRERGASLQSGEG